MIGTDPRPDISPTDWESLPILADWCEEYGDPDEARMWRWLAESRKRPYPSGTTTYGQWYPPNESHVDQESDLPGDLFQLLEGGQHYEYEYEEPGNFYFYRFYLLRQEAYDDLLGAFKKGWRRDGSHKRRCGQ